MGCSIDGSLPQSARGLERSIRCGYQRHRGEVTRHTRYIARAECISTSVSSSSLGSRLELILPFVESGDSIFEGALMNDGGRGRGRTQEESRESDSVEQHDERASCNEWTD